METWRNGILETFKPVRMKASEKAVLSDIKHHIEAIPVMAHNIITRARKTNMVKINEEVCREIIRLSELIIKQ